MSTLHDRPPEPDRDAPARTPSLTRRAFMNGLLIFVIGMLVARLPTTIAQMKGKGEVLDTIGEVYKAVMVGHVDAPDAAKLQKGAIDGMLQALNDDYAEFIPAEDAAMFEKEMTGHFSGIGCQIEIRDGWLTVVTPLEDSPAFDAGIMAGDRISRIGETSTFGLSSDECIKLLTGEPGTQVSFTVQRDGAEMPFTLTRAPITNKTVRGLSRGAGGKWNYLIDPEQRIVYLRLSQFTPSAARELAGSIIESLEQTRGRGFGGMILDLRNNPGGVMDGALEIADMFLKSGTIMSIRGRSSPPLEFAAEPDGTLPDFPLAVIINGGSASASEIVAGALQDHNRAIVVGTRSFGKGLVQTVAHLQTAPNAEVKFTTQRYFLPSGRSIQRTDDSAQWGVDPSPGFYVPMSDREQFEAFLKRRDWDVLRKDGDTAAPAAGVEPQNWADPEWIRAQALDAQLAAALQAVQARITAGDWQPVSDQQQQHGRLAINELRDLQKERRALGMQFAQIEKRLTALRKQAETGETPDDRLDLWADSIDPTGGRVDIFDREGQTIARLSVTGRDLERWLLNADIAPLAEDAAADKSGSDSPPAGGEGGGGSTP